MDSFVSPNRSVVSIVNRSAPQENAGVSLPAPTLDRSHGRFITSRRETNTQPLRRCSFRRRRAQNQPTEHGESLVRRTSLVYRKGTKIAASHDVGSERDLLKSFKLVVSS